MRQVYLIRHCHPAIPAGVRMCLGRTDLPLSSRGLSEAQALGERFRQIPLSAVFTSPLTRCVETARCLSDTPVVLAGLEELDAGLWDGLTFDEIQARDPDLYHARGADPTLLPPEGESAESGLARFRAAMEAACSMAEGDFAVVSHGGILSIYLEYLGLSRRKPAYGEVIPLPFSSFHL